jgi:alpha-D-ribose 1-methylphosphonate 5-triphosphate synthase subunit PhnG
VSAQLTKHEYNAQVSLERPSTNSVTTARLAVLLELGLHRVDAKVQGTDAGIQLYDITMVTAAQRLQLRLHLQASNKNIAKFWSQFIDSYFQQCKDVNSLSHAAQHTTANSDTENRQLYVLVPMFHLLRANPLSMDASLQQIQQAADNFCSISQSQ